MVAGGEGADRGGKLRWRRDRERGGPAICIVPAAVVRVASGRASAVGGSAGAGTASCAGDDRSADVGTGGKAAAANVVLLNWSGAADNVGVTGYRIERNGSVVGETTSTSWLDFNPPRNVPLQYRVAARDAAIVSARTTRLAVDTGGYAFAQRRSGDWRDLAEKPLGPARWTTGTTASKAEVEFDPTGVAEPETRIMLQRGDERVAVDIGADGAVRVAR
mgnify:CR=1 FL=1